jgi:hypothetical protein
MSDPEIEIIDCAECGKPIETHWDEGLLPGDYVLIADWIFHTQCWDKIAERYPIAQREHASSAACWCKPEEIEEGVYVHKQVQ